MFRDDRIARGFVAVLAVCFGLIPALAACGPSQPTGSGNAPAAPPAAAPANPPPAAAPAALAAVHVSALTSTEAVDDYTAKMTLKEPFSPFMSNLSISYFGILSPAAVEKYGDDYGKHPVGTGPFMFKEWVPGDHITLVKNPN